MTETRPSSTIHILVAVIGLVGSLAVAWITTGTKFDRELDGKSGEVTRIQRDLESVEQRMKERQKELDQKVEAVEDRLKKLDEQIALAKDAASKLMKTGSIFGKKPDSK
jgi:hypothetical protein